MAKAFTYNERARIRIGRAVRWVERNRSSRGPSRRAKNDFETIVWAIADEDIEHNSFGTVKRAKGSGFDATSIDPGDDEFEAYNPGAKIWDGTRVFLQFGSLAENSSTDSKYMIMKAWSATRIRGKSDGAISPGSTGSLDSVVGIDGEFPPSTVSGVYLPTDHVTVTDNMSTWAEIRYQASGTSRWEIYSADCDEAS